MTTIYCLTELIHDCKARLKEPGAGEKQFIQPQKSTKFWKSVRIIGYWPVAAADGMGVSVHSCKHHSESWWPFCDLKGQVKFYLKIRYQDPQNSSSASS